MNILAGHHLDACINDLKSWAKITPPNRQSLRAIIKDQDFIDMMNKWYKGRDGSGGGLDTADRDILFDIVANHFAGEHWPLNMEGNEKFQTFRINLTSGLEKEGWTIE